MSCRCHSLVATLISLVVVGAASAGEIPDGIYLLHEKGDGPKVKRNDTGDFLVLGEKLTDRLGTGTIDSTSNDNELFRLDLRGAGPFPKREISGPTAAFIAGHCLMLYSRSDPAPDGTLNLGASIHTDEAMRAVAKTLKVEPRLRKHPGYKLAVNWETDKPRYQAGEPIGVTVKIKNVGEQPVSFQNGGRQRGPRDNQFGFTAFRGYGAGKAVPDTGDPTNFGGIAGMVTLQPGQTFAKAVVLDKWFKLTEPDVYRCTGMFHLEFHDADDGWRRSTWDDFVAGVFVVRIEAPPKK